MTRKQHQSRGNQALFGLELAVRLYLEQERIEHVLARYCESYVEELRPTHRRPRAERAEVVDIRAAGGSRGR